MFCLCLHLCVTSNQNGKMEKLVDEIMKFALNEKVESSIKIQDLGSVNDVYDVKSIKMNYIVRINKEKSKELEFLKEKWCLEKVAELNVPSPIVLKIGVKNNFPYMIQNKIEGLNGSQCTANQKVAIWKKLGQFAYKFHQIKKIEVPQVELNEFHANWKSRLKYNIEQLDKNDSLLDREVFTKFEHEKVKTILDQLIGKKFEEGLVHGDLCPRNTVYNNKITALLDWGTAGINIVPHTEIGIILMENNLKEEAFNAFLEGLKIQNKDYKKIEGEIKILNLLHRLDKYRWACEYDLENIERYTTKIRIAYEEIAIWSF